MRLTSLILFTAKKPQLFCNVAFYFYLPILCSFYKVNLVFFPSIFIKSTEFSGLHGRDLQIYFCFALFMIIGCNVCRAKPNEICFFKKVVEQYTYLLHDFYV